MSGMNEISSMDRTSSFVRTMVRLQLSQNRRSSQGVMDRLYERMKERGEEVDFEPPKRSRLREQPNTSDNNSSVTEDEDDNCDAGAGGEAPKSGAQDKGGTKSAGKAKEELRRTSTGGFLYTPRGRSRSVRTPTPTKIEEDTEGQGSANKVYAVRSANHTAAMNRGLTLAERVKQNYSKFIRTEEEEESEILQETETTSRRAQQQQQQQQRQQQQQQPSGGTSRQSREAPSIVFVSQGPTKVTVSMQRSSSTLGLTTTVEEDFPAEIARSHSALSLPTRFASLPATPDGAQVPGATGKSSGKGTAKKTEGRFRGRSIGNQEDRAEAIKELQKAQSAMDEHMKEHRLRQARARIQAYKRGQLLRAEKMAIFQREMDDIMKRLKDINNRLDGRLRVLERDETLVKVEPQT